MKNWEDVIQARLYNQWMTGVGLDAARMPAEMVD